ncbi:MAG TPA: F0F1 ATP synthase subunit gamma [Acidimicrobiales bacterium]|jgi:F-type H+-transporting ATPase subunit gamma|nr:F0F1 ATP synthase subunit gamma [Acidimicrobiales bacterium]
MAGGQERILRRRIKTVESTKKITKAMELIAASRIVKAQARVAAARPYSEKITEVLRNLAAGGAGGDHPLLKARHDISTVGYVVVTADRGLAGGYNNNVIRAAERAIAADRAQGRSIKLYVVGKKANGYFRFRREPIEAAFLGVTDRPSYEQAREVALAVAAAFNDRELDSVQVVYTQFLSAGTQRVVQRQLMPLEQHSIEDAPASAEASASYEFEPSPDIILSRLLPRYAEARLFAALLDASASEHAARQRAMKSATDNAEDLIKSLSRVMNRARQDAITTEIMEIVGGAEALRQSASDADDHVIDHLSPTDLLGPNAA